MIDPIQELIGPPRGLNTIQEHVRAAVTIQSLAEHENRQRANSLPQVERRYWQDQQRMLGAAFRPLFPLEN